MLQDIELQPCAVVRGGAQRFPDHLAGHQAAVHHLPRGAGEMPSRSLAASDAARDRLAAGSCQTGVTIGLAFVDLGPTAWTVLTTFGWGLNRRLGSVRLIGPALSMRVRRPKSIHLNEMFTIFELNKLIQPRVSIGLTNETYRADDRCPAGLHGVRPSSRTGCKRYRTIQRHGHHTKTMHLRRTEYNQSRISRGE